MPLALRLGMNAYNAACRFLHRVHRPPPPSPELAAIEERTVKYKHDICDHLPTIYAETLAARPKLIVELGVRDGSSRFSLEQAALPTDAHLISVDIEDFSAFCTLSERGHFVLKDDIEFAGAFGEWCTEKNITPKIDVLFIDTSHLFDHTTREIRAWFPLLSQRCKVMFHDTNSKRIYRRIDCTVGGAWNNHRGVIQPIENYLRVKFNEHVDFVTAVNGWVVRHWAHCNGLLVMERF